MPLTLAEIAAGAIAYFEVQVLNTDAAVTITGSPVTRTATGNQFVCYRTDGGLSYWAPMTGTYSPPAPAHRPVLGNQRVWAARGWSGLAPRRQKHVLRAERLVHRRVRWRSRVLRGTANDLRHRADGNRERHPRSRGRAVSPASPALVRWSVHKCWATAMCSACSWMHRPMTSVATCSQTRGR